MICNRYLQFFKTLSDPARLEIIKILRGKSQSVNQICDATKFEQSRVSHNLRKLKEQGFVNVIPKGKERIYELDTKTIIPLLNLIDNHVETYYNHYCKCNEPS